MRLHRVFQTKSNEGSETPGNKFLLLYITLGFTDVFTGLFRMSENLRCLILPQLQEKPF